MSKPQYAAKDAEEFVAKERRKFGIHQRWQQAGCNHQAGAAARPFDQGTEMKFAKDI
jgi:hypothetical protein